MSGKNSKWYIINPFKLKNVKHRLLVSEADKEQILSATKLIISISQSLAAESTFKQRIAYFKAFLPSSLFQLKRKSLTYDQLTR
jgi:hypothetical protein